MIRLLVPAAVVVVLVAAVGGVSAWNRSGPHVMALTVTERELGLSPYAPAREAAGDDPGLALIFDVGDGHGDVIDSLNWLPPATLRALGFDLSLPTGSPDAARAYARALDRPAWVAFEYDGPAWQALSRRPDVARRARGRSRLVPVDAGAEFAPLVERYADGAHVVLPAVIGLEFVPADRGGPLVHGTLRSVVPRSLRVPPDMVPDLANLDPVARLRRDGLDGEPTSGDPGDPSPDLRPRYQVDLAIGRLGLPFIVGIRPIP
ncbi:MAG: DUF4824 family protein [Vicinamibacterales bacterium]